MIGQKPRYSKAPDGKPWETQPKWRRDFPVDKARDQHVSRRDFVKFLTLISGAFFVGQLWIAWKNYLRAREGQPPIKAIAALDSLAVGESLSFEYPSEKDPCLLIRTDETTYVAFSQKCTHLACAVVPEFGKGRLFCPCHEGHFDLKTGVPTGGPPTRPLPRVILEVRGGMIYATGMELRV
jgi:Rieske Fe-S protein